MKRLMQRFRDMGLIRKLVLLYISVLLLPMLVLSVYTYGRTQREYADNLRYSSTINFRQTMGYLSYRFDRIARMFTNMQLNEQLNGILEGGIQPVDVHRQIANQAALATYLNSIADNQGEIRPKLYIRSEYLYAYGGVSLFPMWAYEGEAWMRESLRGWGWLTFCPPSTTGDAGIIAMVRPLRSLQKYTDIIAVARVDIPLDTLSETIQLAATTPDSVAYIQSPQGEVILASSEALLERFQIPVGEAVRITQGLADVMEVAAAYDLACLAVDTIPRSDWLLVSLTPGHAIGQQMMDTLKNLLIIFFVVLVAGIGLSLPIVNRITRGIFVMHRRMDSFQAGDYATRFTPDSRDEIGGLMHSFNLMLERIEALAWEQYALGTERRTAEMMALQSQINSHFLYNTLDLINWMIVGKKEEEAKRIVLSMARFYRLSLSKGRDVIPIAEEVEMLRNYILIQNARFRDSVAFAIDMDGVLGYQIPKITLQPIVENAILHGILEKPSKRGTIRVAGQVKDGEVIIDIDDDGVGMDFDGLEAQAGKGDVFVSGYGLVNINRRLCLYFGVEQGLFFYPIEGGGTRVRVRVPAVHVEA